MHKRYVCFLILFLVSPKGVQAETDFRPEELKLFIPKPKPNAADIQIRKLSVPTPPVKPSPTATELLNPLLKVFSNLDFAMIAQGEALNADAFKSAKSLAYAPSELEVQSKFQIRPKLVNLKPLELMIAKRAMKAISEYEPSEGEVTGKVCVNSKGLFQKINSFRGLRPGGTEPQVAIIEMPAKELVLIEIDNRDNTRYVGVTLEFEEDLSFFAQRYSLELPLKITWDYGKLAVLAEGYPLDGEDAEGCVLELTLNAMEPTFIKNESIPIPRTKRVKNLTHVQVRVAPPGQKILGTPVLVEVE